MNERRAKPRRTRNLIPEALTRKSERRQEDRRDAPRREVEISVREQGKKSQTCPGDVSLGGASFVTTQTLGDSVELTFTIPTAPEPIVATAFVVARGELARGTQVRVVFTELELEAELAIAHWLDDALSTKS